MKNETARREIESLDYYLQNHTTDYSEESHMAMMMAIKALEQTELNPSYNRVKTELEPCEDCISREAVEKITWEEPSYDDALNVLTEVRDKVRALPSVTPPHTRWIPVSERLPEKDEVVLITNKWHEVDKALYIGGEMFDIIINYLQKEEVIAWMPLPEPYKAESEGEK